jgi:hypothetical protein
MVRFAIFESATMNYKLKSGEFGRLSNIFGVDNTARVKCSEVLEELSTNFKDISARECGFIVRKCFPTVRRVHSSHVYYYSGIRRLLKAAENSESISPQPGIYLSYRLLGIN